MTTSPLRYPGGKAKLFPYFAEIIKQNRLFDVTYSEPYAGGAGLALKLLSTGFVRQVVLNDIDISIYSFWFSVLNFPDEFCRLIENTEITIEEWHRQKLIWKSQGIDDPLSLGFATFFLNRTNRSGIIDGAGPIGGYSQDGPWTLDVRLNKYQQIKNIQSLKEFRSRISLHNEDAMIFIRRQIQSDNNFCYLDPPYYVKGGKLYKNSYEHADHCEIARLLSENKNEKWVVSYDDVPEIREIYKEFRPVSYSLNYSAGAKSAGREVIYFSDSVTSPPVPGYDMMAA